MHEALTGAAKPSPNADPGGQRSAHAVLYRCGRRCAPSTASASRSPPARRSASSAKSGSGKSVAALSLMRLLEEPSAHRRRRDPLPGPRHRRRCEPEELRKLRGDGIAMVFQDPMTSLNPVLKIARQLVETMLVHGRLDRGAGAGPGRDLLGRMGITAPERAIDSYPHQFSGGMRQRVMLAMGFANEPALLIARRADHRARRHHPGADPRADARAQSRFRHRHRPHQPRPRRHRQRLCARRRHVRRRGGRGRADRGRSSPIRAIPTPGR